MERRWRGQGRLLMGLNKITDEQRLELLTMYAAGFREEARAYALSLGLTEFYATVLYNRMCDKILHRKRRKHTQSWLRAVEAGLVVAAIVLLLSIGS